MGNSKLLKYTEYIATGIFFSGIFIFFAFFYNNHLHFEEATQLFLFSGDYLASKINLPGGFSGWTGAFLTQFYYWSVAGALIITILLFAVQQITMKLLSRVNGNRSFFPLSFLVPLNIALILCDEFYPLSALTGFLTALLAAWLYISIDSNRKRFPAGILLLALTYFLAGGSVFSLVAVMVSYEVIMGLKASREKGKHNKTTASDFTPLKFWQIIIFIAVSVVLPLAIRQFFIMEPAGLAFFSEFYYNLRTMLPKAIPILFALPAILMFIFYFLPSREKVYKIALTCQILLLVPAISFGLKLWANFGAEEIMHYDHLARMERWKDVISLAERKPPRNNLSLAMLNLSLAKTGTMGDKMFKFEQSGVTGLFLPFVREYVAPMVGSEVFYHLGLINACQEYIFESCETTPNLGKTARAIKRLAETNLINGNYDVARKYIRLLEKTLFYRKWALRAEKYLGNENMINKDPDWGEKRKMMIKSDFFFKVEIIEGALNMLLKEDPQNKLAYQYLMAFYMVNKDLKNFMQRVPMMNDLGYSSIPLSYQEAIMYIIGLTTDNPLEQNLPYKISIETKRKMAAYAEIYTSMENPQATLAKQFPDTYWYYFHFKRLDVKPTPR
jgi:hypothetical protein